MHLLLMKTQTGLVAVDDESRAGLAKLKLGSISRLEIRQMRNGQFFRKWWALVKLGYDYFSESCQTQEYKGKPVEPEFDRFRKDVTIMAGFYRPVWNIKNEMRIEPESLAWASMTEDRFEQLYSATIKVLLDKVFNGTCADQWTEEQLRQVAEQIQEFA